MDREESIRLLIARMEAFLTGQSYSISSAQEIEGAIDELFSEDDEILELVDYLAQYEPHGGEYLFSYEQLKPKVAYFLDKLKSSRN